MMTPPWTTWESSESIEKPWYIGTTVLNLDRYLVDKRLVSIYHLLSTPMYEEKTIRRNYHLPRDD